LTNQSLNNLSESQLAELLVQKDKRALEYLYDNYSASLYGVILRIVGGEKIAEEILQDVMIRVWTKISTFDPNKGRLFTWMLNISRNLSIDKLRSKEISKDSKTESIANNVYSYDHQSDPEPGIDRIGVKDLLDSLVEDQRIVVEYIYFKGYSHSEACQELQIPLGTVKTRLRNALIQLRKVVQ